jgi:hypothetical protein
VPDPLVEHVVVEGEAECRPVGLDYLDHEGELLEDAAGELDGRLLVVLG